MPILASARTPDRGARPHRRRSRRAVLAGFLAAAVLTGTASAQDADPEARSLPDGYVAIEAADLPEHLVEVFPDSAFSIRIDRRTDDDGHRQMIRLAERLVPASERFEAILEEAGATNADRGNWPNLLAHARSLEDELGPRWWWVEWDDALLPVALGAPAVQHYLELVRTRATSANPFGEGDHRGHLTYTARVVEVEGEDAKETPWAVELELRFSYWCGELCALSFVHDRRIHFDASGNAVRVEGDRPAQTLVS